MEPLRRYVGAAVNGRQAKALRKAARAAVTTRPLSELEKYAAAMATWATAHGRTVKLKRGFALGRERVVLVLHTPKDAK